MRYCDVFRLVVAAAHFLFSGKNKVGPKGQQIMQTTMRGVHEEIIGVLLEIQTYKNMAK